MTEKNTKVTAKYMGARVSPKKTALVLNLVRGKNLEEAKVILAFDKSKAAGMILKVVKSAEANAINNNKLDKSKLVVEKIWVSGAPTQKRMQPGAKGQADPRLKRYSHIYVVLSEGGSK
jgi:large subunit ribosomal protein L22